MACLAQGVRWFEAGLLGVVFLKTTQNINIGIIFMRGYYYYTIDYYNLRNLPFFSACIIGPSQPSNYTIDNVLVKLEAELHSNGHKLHNNRPSPATLPGIFVGEKVCRVHAF